MEDFEDAYYDIPDVDNCECCDSAVIPYVDAYHCDTCGALICSACIEPGDDVTGDYCPLCGGRF